MTHPDNDKTSDGVTAQTTAAFHSFLGEPDATSPAGPEATMSGVERASSGVATLVIRRGLNSGSRFMLDQPVSAAGRHPDSRIFLDDITVSRRHAEFRLENGAFWVVDVGSLNGTYINREPVDSAPLAHGDEIQIGKFRLLFTHQRH